MEEVVPKIARQEAWVRDNPERGELDPADDVHRRCKKNSSSILSCIKRTREGCDCGSEVGTAHSKQDGGKASSSEETERIWQKREL